MAIKNAKTFSAERTMNITHHPQINACTIGLTHDCHAVSASAVIGHEAPSKFSTSQNNQFAQYIKHHHTTAYIRVHAAFFKSSGFLLNNSEAHPRTKNAIITHNVMSLITLYITFPHASLD